MWEWQEGFPLDLATEGEDLPLESAHVAQEVLGHDTWPLALVGVVGYYWNHQLRERIIQTNVSMGLSSSPDTGLSRSNFPVRV